MCAAIRRLPSALAIGVFLSTLTACRFFPEETLTGRAWQAKGSVEEAIYPETSDPVLQKKSDFGICFSGGGNRSAVATFGELRALRKAGILSRARYVSAVSGGTWGSAPWVFLQNPGAVEEELYFGEIKPAGQLAPEDFTHARDGSFISAAAAARFPLRDLILRLAGDENYSLELGRIYLSKFGLSDPRRIPVYGTKGMRRMMRQNPSLREDDFLVCREGRPFFIAGSAISRRDAFVHHPKDLYVPFEFTTDYAGARMFSSKSHLFGRMDVPIGGGYVENAIYDGYPRCQTRTGEGCFSVQAAKARPFSWFRSSSRLSLSDMLGASGSAPTALMPGLASVVGFPEFQHYSPGNLPSIRDRELLHTDGGAMENLGIMPLLARGVKNILVFSNTEEIHSTKQTSEEIGLLFGVPYLRGGSFYGQLMNKRSQQLAHLNHVLKDPDGSKRKALDQALDRAARKGVAMFHRDTYDVIPCPAYGVKGGYEVNICWMVLGPFNKDNLGHREIPMERLKWFKELPDRTQRELLNHRQELESFPHYATFNFKNNGRRKVEEIIHLSKIQANALAWYTSYTTQCHADDIRNHLLKP
jgi:hypothetical protein